MDSILPELLLKKEVYNIIGAAIEVQRKPGNGFLEAIYQEALELELKSEIFHLERKMEKTDKLI